MCTLCETKPATTYDNFVGDIGHAYLDGYERKSFVEVIEAFMAE